MPRGIEYYISHKPAVRRRFIEAKNIDIAKKKSSAEATVNILGKKRYIGIQRSNRIWKTAVPLAIPIFYSEKTLSECAEENKLGLAKWWLIYIHGFSLLEQRQKMGAGHSGRSCFYNNSWWLDPLENPWAFRKTKSGYYLIDFSGRFRNMTWQEQESEIRKLGPAYERANETLLSEAFFSIYRSTSYRSTGKRMLKNWYHWGKSLIGYDSRVCIGNTSVEGLDITDYYINEKGNWLRVCLERKFDFQFNSN